MPSCRQPARAWIALAAAVTLTVARAAIAAPEDEATARAHYQKGTRLYMIGEYRKAADEFKEGYLSNGDPAFLYNLGRCHERLGDRDQAVTFYRRFLAAAPGTTKRAEIEGQILALQGGAAARPLPAAALPSTPPAEPKRPVYKRAWFWDVVVTGLIGAVIGLSFALKH